MLILKDKILVLFNKKANCNNHKKTNTKLRRVKKNPNRKQRKRSNKYLNKLVLKELQQ